MWIVLAVGYLAILAVALIASIGGDTTAAWALAVCSMVVGVVGLKNV